MMGKAMQSYARNTVENKCVGMHVWYLLKYFPPL
jgi:hypothetical protein